MRPTEVRRVLSLLAAASNVGVLLGFRMTYRRYLDRHYPVTEAPLLVTPQLHH